MRNFKALVSMRLNSPKVRKKLLFQQRRNSSASRYSGQPIKRMKSSLKGSEEGLLPHTSTSGVKNKLRQEDSFIHKTSINFYKEKNVTIDERIKKLEEELLAKDNYIDELKEKNESLRQELTSIHTTNDYTKPFQKRLSTDNRTTIKTEYNIPFIRYNKPDKTNKRHTHHKIDIRKWNTLKKLIDNLYKTTTYKDFFTILEKYYWTMN